MADGGITLFTDVKVDNSAVKNTASQIQHSFAGTLDKIKSNVSSTLGEATNLAAKLRAEASKPFSLDASGLQSVKDAYNEMLSAVAKLSSTRDLLTKNMGDTKTVQWAVDAFKELDSMLESQKTSITQLESEYAKLGSTVKGTLGDMVDPRTFDYNDENLVKQMEADNQAKLAKQQAFSAHWAEVRRVEEEARRAEEEAQRAEEERARITAEAQNKIVQTYDETRHRTHEIVMQMYAELRNLSPKINDSDYARTKYALKDLIEEAEYLEEDFQDWKDIEMPLEGASFEIMQRNLAKYEQSVMAVKSRIEELNATTQATQTPEGVPESSGASATLEETKDRMQPLMDMFSRMKGTVGETFGHLHEKLVTTNHDFSNLKGGVAAFIGFTTAGLMKLGGVVQTKLKQGFQSAARAAGKALQSIGGKLKSLIGRFGELKKHADKSLDGFGNKAKRITLQMIKAMIGVRGLYMLFRKLKSAFTEAFKEMSEAVPEVNEVMTAFKSELNSVKMSLATAFQPILQVVLPILTTFLSVIRKLLNALGNFFAILTGQGYIYEWADAQQDYADAIGNTGKAAKKAKRDLMGFDEINRLSDNDSGSGSGGGGSSGGADGAFKQVPVTDPDGAIANFIQKIKDAWKNADFTEIGAWLGTKMKDGLENFKGWLKSNHQLASNVGSSIATFLNGIFSVEDLGKTFGETIGEAINLGLTGLDTFLDKLDWEAAGTQIGGAVEGLFNNSIDWKKCGGVFAKALNGAIIAINWAQEQIDFGNLGSNIGTALNTFFNDPKNGIDWVTAASTFSKLFNNVFVKGIGGAAATFEFGTLGSNIGKALNTFFNNPENGIDWKGVAGVFANVFNGVFVKGIGGAAATFEFGKLGTNIKTALETFFNDKENGVDWDGLAKTFGTVFNGMLDGIESLGKFDLATAATNIFNCIDDMINGEGGIDWTKLGNIMGTAFNGIFSVIDTEGHSFIFTNLGTNIANSINEAIKTADFTAAGASVSSCITDFMTGAVNAVTKTDWESIGNKVMNFFGGIDWAGIVGGLGELLNGVGNGVVKLIKGGVEAVSWDGAADTVFKSLKEAWEALDFKELLVNIALTIKDAAEGVVTFSFQTARIIVDSIEDFAEGATETSSGMLQGQLESGQTPTFLQHLNNWWTGVRSEMWSALGAESMAEGAKRTGSWIDSLLAVTPKEQAYVEWYQKKMKELQNDWHGSIDDLQPLSERIMQIDDTEFEAYWASLQGNISDTSTSISSVTTVSGGLKKALDSVIDRMKTTGSEVKTTGAAFSGGQGPAKGYMATIQTGSLNVVKSIQNIPTALDPLADAFDSTSTASFKNLTAPFTGTADWIKGITDTVDKNLAPMADSTKKTAESSYTNLTTSFNGTASWAQTKAKGITDKFSAIVGGIKTSATSANTNMETAFSKSDSWAQGRVRGILDKFATMPNAINKDATDSNANMENAFSGSAKWSQDKVKGILDQFATMPNAINTDATDSYNNMTTAFNGTNDWATTTLGLITGQFDLLPESMQTDADGAYKNMTTAFDGTEDWASGVYGDITGTFDPFAEFMDMEGSDANDYFRKHFDDIPTWSSDTLDALKGGFDDGSANGMKSWFDSVGTDAYGSMTSPFDRIRDFADSKYNALKLGFGFGTADSPVSIFTNEFNKAYSAISTIFGGMGGMGEKEWGNFKGAFSSVSTWFGGTFGDAWQAVQNVFSKGGSIFQGMADSVTEPMKSMINRIVSGTNNVVAGPFQKLNERLMKIKEVQIGGLYPFKDIIYKIGIPQIPLLAKGGVIPPNKEFLAVLGDQSNGTNVEAPLSTIQEAVAQVMMSNNAELMRGFMMVVEAINNKNLVIGDKEIGRANSRYTNRENIRRGYAT